MNEQDMVNNCKNNESSEKFEVIDKNSDLLIAVGGTIIVAGLLSDYINVWLKQVGSRPRYKYLITLDLDLESDYDGIKKINVIDWLLNDE